MATAVLISVLAAFGVIASTSTAIAQCTESQANAFQGGGTVSCPCFVTGEQAGVYFDGGQIPNFPIHITKVGIGWGSQLGGQPQSIEQAFHIYASGLPNPGGPVFTQLGPQLTDGAINEYDITIENVVVTGPFSVTLEFLNANAGNPFTASVVHDGNGCTPSHNLVFAIPGGWSDACTLGVTGDWVFFVKYTECTPTGIADERIVSSATIFLRPLSPNPFRSSTQVEFFLREGGHATVSVFDVSGREVVTLTDQHFDAGTIYVSWDGSSNGLPLASGVYFVELRSNGERAVRKVSLRR